MKTKPDVRPSPIAGQWYPADPHRLAAQVDQFIDQARCCELDGDVIGVISPHAGHRYSGPVAGYAFAALRGQKPDLVVVIAPMHYPYHQPLLTTAHEAYATPLGLVPVDQQAVVQLDSLLQAELGFGIVRVAHDPEHSLEIELPFLQRVFTHPFQLLPVMIRDQSLAVTRALGKAVAKLMAGRSAVLVASTDLSHFYPRELADVLDAEILRQVKAFNPAGVLEVEAAGKGFACGHGAVAAVLWAAQELGADQVQILQHATSGDVTGDFDQVVGYAAAAILRTRKMGAENVEESRADPN